MKRRMILNAIIAVALCCCLQPNNCDANDEVVLSIFDNSYIGHFDEDGAFVCGDEGEGFSLDGEWKDAAPDGSVVITFDAGRVIEASYEDGLINGRVKDIAPDGTYKTYLCKDGMPYGLVSWFDADGKAYRYDHLYQGMEIDSLIEKSKEIDYRDYATDSYLSIIPAKVNGEVIAVYDTKKTQTVLIKDEDNHYYVLSFYNEGYNQFNQAVFPFLRIGERVNAYGFVKGMLSFDTSSIISSEKKMWPVLNYEYDEAEKMIIDSGLIDPDTDVINGSFPRLLTFYIEKEDGKVDLLNFDQQYVSIMENSYYCAGMDILLSGTVERANVNTSSQEAKIVLLDDHDQKYYLEYHYEEGDSVPLRGDYISINGYLNGNYKENEEIDIKINKKETEKMNIYLYYPRVVIDTVEFPL